MILINDKQQLRFMDKKDNVRMADVSKSTAVGQQRPLGITVLGIIFIIFGIWMAVAAAMIGTLTAMIASSSPMIGNMMGTYSNMMGSMVSVFGGVIAVFIGIFAAVEFAIAWALFSGKNWGRITVIVLSSRLGCTWFNTCSR